MRYLPLESAPVGHLGYQQKVKESNIKRIFDLVRSEQCKSRAELVRTMQLSATSVSGLVEELKARGLISEAGPQQTSQPGRRPISLNFNRDARQIVVFTIDFTGVHYTLLNLGCEVLETAFLPVDEAQLDPDDSGNTYAAAFEELLEKHAPKFDAGRTILVGISFIGQALEEERALSLRPRMDTQISEASLRRFQRRIGLPMGFANRTKCMAYAEKKIMDAESDASPGGQDMLYVAIRHGVSGALIHEGKLFSGRYSVAGALGHITIDHNGRPCPCGSAGCLERYVSLDAILARAQQACRDAGIAAPESLDALPGFLETPAVVEALNQSADLLASGLYSALCVTGARRIVLGGGIEMLGEGFLRRLYHSLCARSLFIRTLDLSYAQLGPESDSIGLAQYFLDQTYTITF